MKMLLKFILATGLMAWLIQSGKLDFSLVKRTLLENPWWPIACLIFLLGSFLGSFRWKTLLLTRSSQKLPMTQVFKMTWIGMFFSTYLPGTVSGDLIKLVYAKELDRSLPKTFLVLTVLLDRILGLVGLILIMSLMSLIGFLTSKDSFELIAPFLPFNLTLFLGALIFMSGLLAPQKIQTYLLSFLQRIPYLGKPLKKTLEQVWHIGASKKTISIAIIISVFVQFATVFVFWLLIAPFLENNVSFFTLFSFIPLGLISTALPISPAGLGVGHLVFEGLFQMAGVSGGSSLFNIYFMMFISMNSLGAIPYLLHRKPIPSEDMLENLGDKT